MASHAQPAGPHRTWLPQIENTRGGFQQPRFHRPRMKPPPAQNLPLLKRRARQQLRTWLKTGAVVLMDGAMGTELLRRYRVLDGLPSAVSSPSLAQLRQTSPAAGTPISGSATLPATGQLDEETLKPESGQSKSSVDASRVSTKPARGARGRCSSKGRESVLLPAASANLGELLASLAVCQPDWVRSVHRSYLRSGAQCLLANTFLAWPRRSNVAGLRYFRQLNRLAIRLARETVVATGRPVPILASIGPWPDASVFSVQQCLAQWQAVRDADAVLLETQSSLAFLEAVLAGTVSGRPLPVLLSFTFRRLGDRYVTWPEQHTPEQIAAWANHQRGRIAVLGVNCGYELTLADITRIVRSFRRETDLPILVRPNAGTPQQRHGRCMYPLQPEDFAAALPEWLEAGARWLGGCCGTTPRHIAAMRRALRQHKA